MGQLLSQPITEKHIRHHEHPHLGYSIGEMQGYRLTMEDAHCEFVQKLQIVRDAGAPAGGSGHDSAVLKVAVTGGSSQDAGDETTTAETALHYAAAAPQEKEILINIFGVFDGHGGSSVSNYICKKLPEIILRNVNHSLSKIRFQDAADMTRQIPLPQILKQSFLECDDELFRRNEKSGSTAIIVVLVNDQVIVANTGDSRCIISCDGVPKTMSFDHKPGNYGELLRIHQDGGYVSYNRVNGILALSRAFGDFGFKNDKQQAQASGRRLHQNPSKPPEEFAVSVDPEILIHRLNLSKDEFVILACDGIWDCFKNKDLVLFVRNLLALGKNLDEVIEVILDECLKMANTVTGVGFDNMTITILAIFEEGEDMTGWYARIKNKILDQKFGRNGH